ncbi:MAG: glycosyltransferase family 4 protein [Planctomycetes bacterium]|nr:glycosyltransferase family 4 protein [Planctomycetota bacterium]
MRSFSESNEQTRLDSAEKFMSLRILMTTNYFWPIVGGAEEQARKLGKELVARGHQVTYVAAKFPGLEAYEEIDGIHIYRLTCAPWAKYTRKYLAQPIFLVSFLYFLLSCHRQFDVLHSHGIFSIYPSFAVVLMGRMLGKSSIVKYASLNEQDRARRAFLGNFFYEIVCKWADRFVGNSPVLYAKMTSEYGLDREKCFFIPNGVKVLRNVTKNKREIRQTLDLPLDSKIVICVSNFSPGKNQIAVVRAWPRVLADFPNIYLVFLGTGKELETCYNEASRLGIIERVLFLGKVHNVKTYLQASDIFIFPSDYPEGMSNALLEAMAVGLPCVASHIAQNMILIQDGENGLAFDPTDWRTLQVAVQRLLGDEKLAQRLGERARETVEQNYSIEHIADKYLDLYGGILSEKSTK